MWQQYFKNVLNNQMILLTWMEQWPQQGCWCAYRWVGRCATLGPTCAKPAQWVTWRQEPGQLDVSKQVVSVFFWEIHCKIISIKCNLHHSLEGKKAQTFHIWKENIKQLIIYILNQFSLQQPEDKHIKACYLLGFRTCQHFEAAINIWNILAK